MASESVKMTATCDQGGTHRFCAEVEEIDPNGGIAIAWRNLGYEVRQFSGWKLAKKPILRQLNGHFTANSLNGLMGPSGAGKTTLLNCLSGSEAAALTADSEIYLNSTSTSQVSYFIEQHVHENIVGQMSVGQVLRYAFRFKNGSCDEAVMNEHVRKTMAQLMLPSELASRPFSKCSGGEQKRVAIAQELMCLHAPSFLFLDEPTTGLDSAAAVQVVQCLKSLTQTHRITIIASIHAPNNEILNLFHKLYVLAKGGVCIYSGPPQQVRPFVEHEIALSIPEHQPPIEALTKLACNGIQDKKVIKLANQTHDLENALILPQINSISNQNVGILATRKSFSFSNFLTELHRFCEITFNSNINTLLSTCFIFISYFTFLSTIFSSKMASESGCYMLESHNKSATCSNFDQLERDSLVKQNLFFITYLIAMIGFILICTSSLHFATFAKVFRNEHRNFWYSLGVFFWSTSIVSFIEVNLYAVLITLLSYFLTHQHAADMYTINWTRLALYFLFVWLLCIYSQSSGQLIGSMLINHPHIAIVFCMLVSMSTCLFNGQFIKLDRSGSETLAIIAEYIGVIHISRGILYALYGFDRCVAGNEYSWVLVDNSIDIERIGEYATRVFVNYLVIRALTFAAMYCKFGTFRKRTRNNEKRSQNGSNNIAPIDLDFKTTATTLESFECPIEITNYQNINNEMIIMKNTISIAWRNLNLYSSSSIFEISSSKLDKEPILQYLNGQFRFGTLNALMGTSGAGKTSLLRVLNGHCKTRIGDSTRFYLSKFAKITTCFITQEVSGHLMPGLTAKQMLVYASRLKNANEDVDHEAIAIGLLNELDLANTESTRVERCSGGERKRLALALELTSVQMPNLVCIDEPTSGLDSNSAEIVISCLCKLTHAHNLTIIASIHQPNTEILAMFDQLYVLARGGVCIFSGPPNQIQNHLNHLHQTAPYPASNYLIEELIKYSCYDHNDQIVQELLQLNNVQYSDKEIVSSLANQTQPVPDGVALNRQRFSFHSVLNLSLRFLVYIRAYLWKEWAVKLLNYLGYGFALLTFYDRKMIYVSGCINIEEDNVLFNTCNKTAAQLEEEFLLKDSMYYSFVFSNLFLVLILLSSSLNLYSHYRQFENEHRNGWYSAGAFYLTISVFEIVPLIPVLLIYIYIVDIFDPVISGGIYWQLVFLLTIAAIAFQGLGHCFAVLGRGSLHLQTVILVCTYLLLVVISNFVVPIAEMHYVYQFLSNFSIARFTFQAVALLVYGFGRCRPREVQAILYSMSLQDSDYYRAIWMLIFNLIFFRVAALWLLVWRANPIENRRKRVARIEKYCDNLKPAKLGDGVAMGSSVHQFKLRMFV